jgi:hypothetical protein
MPLMGLRRGNSKPGFAVRLLWLKVALALALLSGFLLSARLWVSDSRYYPLTPVFEGLPAILSPVEGIWFISLLFLLTAIALVLRPRKPILAFIILAGLLSLFDQSRWQPWFYQYLFMLAALALYPWGEQDPKKQEAALNVCRLIVVSTYFWSGLQKLNASFVENLFPLLFEPLVALLPGFSKELVHPLGIVVPFIEAGIGVGLLTRRFRNVAIVLAVGMHVFIVFSLGPIGHDQNTVVWPWNIAMIAFVVILFWRSQSFSAKDVLFPRASLFHGLVLLLFGVMPLFSFFGLWDSYLSASLYSDNIRRATIYVSDTVKSSLPETIRDSALESGGNEPNIISLTQWSHKELNVAPYPEDRIFKNVARRVCEYAEEPSEVELVVEGKPNPVDGSKKAEVYDCSGLKTGEHETLNIE